MNDVYILDGVLVVVEQHRRLNVGDIALAVVVGAVSVETLARGAAGVLTKYSRRRRPAKALAIGRGDSTTKH